MAIWGGEIRKPAFHDEVNIFLTCCCFFPLLGLPKIGCFSLNRVKRVINSTSVQTCSKLFSVGWTVWHWGRTASGNVTCQMHFLEKSTILVMPEIGNHDLVTALPALTSLDSSQPQPGKCIATVPALCRGRTHQPRHVLPLMWMK